MSILITGFLYIVAVVLIIMAGGVLNRRLAGFSPEHSGSDASNTKPLHKRWSGYTEQEAQEYFESLENMPVGCGSVFNTRDDNQLKRYKKLLSIDYSFAVLYFLALSVLVGYYIPVLAMPYIILLLPIAYLIADITENYNLSAAVAVYQDPTSADNATRALTRKLTLASLATVSKLVFIVMTILTITTGLFTQWLAQS